MNPTPLLDESDSWSENSSCNSSDDIDELKEPPRPTWRRRLCAPFFIALGTIISLVVLILPRSEDHELETVTAIGVNVVNGSSNVSYKCVNRSHWLPIDDFEYLHRKVDPGIANVNDPSNNSFVEPVSRATIVFRGRVMSMKECAIMARAYNKSFFSWESQRQVCYLNDPTNEMVLDTGVNYETKEECVRMCSRTLKCVGMTFVDGECTFYKPSQVQDSISAGWIIPPNQAKSSGATPSPPRPYIGKPSAVHFYVTAHQDDHELFMSKPIYASFRDPTTKIVFIYTTAGDANRTDGWWQAREVGTLAATKFFVQDFGYYTADSNEESAIVLGRTVQRVTMANVVHYFLRLSECNMSALVKNQTVATKFLPLGKQVASGGYANITDIQDVIQDILRMESKNISAVSAITSEYATSGNDHELHKATGQLMDRAIQTDDRLANCTSKRFYFGYEYWLTDVNMQDPELSFQRRAWLALSAAIECIYSKKDVWTNHAINLGRTYIARSVTSSNSCSD
ncbi:hypothetical protein LEN26_007985 [Aphanomyces euteiches]|nr:hypothetical protein LEN26_007985 [Aphanomyces euteiches]